VSVGVSRRVLGLRGAFFHDIASVSFDLTGGRKIKIYADDLTYILKCYRQFADVTVITIAVIYDGLTISYTILTTLTTFRSTLTKYKLQTPDLAITPKIFYPGFPVRWLGSHGAQYSFLHNSVVDFLFFSFT